MVGERQVIYPHPKFPYLSKEDLQKFYKAEEYRMWLHVNMFLTDSESEKLKNKIIKNAEKLNLKKKQIAERAKKYNES